VGWIRSSIQAREDSLLSDLSLPAPQAVGLSLLSLPTQVADAVRGDLATYHMTRTHLTVFRAEVLADWLKRIFVPISAVVVFVALALAERLRWPSAGIVHSLMAVLATAAAMVVLWILDKISRDWATICVAVASGIGAAFLLRSPGQAA
jgi:hypothetical protein